ncbi:cbb3-type cytochrome c oxidase subunit III [Inmirania thermothiophila]|uniref:Cbb3-type cytochrome c oxidase subunit III n=1 Tax=Inmirania thermothiophila TaxID=1750597 RepID=A0A3N1XSF2_9GAMM|nr:cbb3-type cytochrome c oxidase subunit III [Inmirania thermothiophila]
MDAARIYHENCSVCHGDRGDGRTRAANNLVPPPRDFTAPDAAVELTRERMVRSVMEGRPGTAMPPWKAQLTRAEIEAVVGYIREHFMRPVASEEVEAGRRIYAENCSVCHGERGDGRSRAAGRLDPPPTDFTHADPEELTRERMIHSVSFGRPNTAMPPWRFRLSEEEIETVVDYIRTAFMPAPAAVAGRGGAAGPAGEDGGGHGHETPSGDLAAFMAEPMPKGLEGDPEWGRRFFEENCAACHGKNGDGRGPRSFFIFPRPRDFSHPGAVTSLNREHLFEAIAMGDVGSEMPAWSKVLTDQEIANVAEYVFQAFIEPRLKEILAATGDDAAKR